MATWTFITGDIVSVEADTEAEAWQLMESGDYTHEEAITELRLECPNHEGDFDCTPFCPECEGEQELPAIRKHGEHR